MNECLNERKKSDEQCVCVYVTESCLPEHDNSWSLFHSL